MAYTLDYSLALGSSKTGLTLVAQLVTTAGANSGSAITTGFSEIGTGNYLWHYAAFADSFRGGVKFYEDGVPATILAFAAINPEEVENADVKTSTRSVLVVSDIAPAVLDALTINYADPGSIGEAIGNAGSSTDPLLNNVPGTYNAGTAGAALGRIGSGQISTTSIVAQNGDVETYRGDSYANADARRIDWTDTSANWPTLIAATILVVIGGDVSFAGSVIVATGAGKKVGLELTSAQSATIPQGKLDFVVIATLASGNQVTLLEGTWTSKRRLAVGS